jgi:hypothetical protein
MAVLDKNESIVYYLRNIVKSPSEWEILNNATVVSGKIEINSSGYAGNIIQGTYFNGTQACKYIGLVLEIEAQPNDNYNYINYVEIVLRGTYTNGERESVNYYSSVPLTSLMTSETSEGSGIYKMGRVLVMPNFNFDTLNVYIYNHSSGTITLDSLTMYRSQDINETQVASSIGLNIAISQVDAYTDGCEVWFDSQDEPLKMWWSEDSSGNFNGINMNNERFVAFNRHNEVLLD